MGLMGLGHLVKYGMDEFLIADFMGDYGTWEGWMIVNMLCLIRGAKQKHIQMVWSFIN